MRVLFLGSEHPSATSRHRADAFRRLGHDVVHLDPLNEFSPKLSGNTGRLHYYTGYSLLRSAVSVWLEGAITTAAPFDLCWVDSGEMIGANAVECVRSRSGRVILFNHDDPTGPRDWRRFFTLRSAISRYDACVVVRRENVSEFRTQGARKVVHVLRTYDEAAHAPPPEGTPISKEYQSDVCFIGTNLKHENRDILLSKLIKKGLNVAIWGERWERSREWHLLARHHRGGSLSGAAYVDAIRGAKVCLGLLASQNRDQHTTRSMEIPFAGGVLCAQRTPEHSDLYEEGREAVFWSNFDECYSACTSLISNSEEREKIRQEGRRRVRENRVGNEDMIRCVLDAIHMAA